MWYWVGMLLRMDGTVEFYSDFIYTDIYKEKDNICVDIEIGAQDFFFKNLNIEENKKPLAETLENDVSTSERAKEFKYNYSRVATSWKNRIGPSTIKRAKKSEVSTFEQVVDR